MGESISKFVIIIVAVIILFIYPVLNMFENQDDTSKVFVLTETAQFVDSVRNLGYITPNMYLEFSRKIAVTNNIYQIDMEHYHVKYDPIYDDPTIPSTFKSDFHINYQGTFTSDIMETLFPDSSTLDRVYKLSKGDYFAMRVVNKNKTIATRIQDMIFNADLGTAKIVVRYGGMVKDENY